MDFVFMQTNRVVSSKSTILTIFNEQTFIVSLFFIFYIVKRQTRNFHSHFSVLILGLFIRSSCLPKCLYGTLSARRGILEYVGEIFRQKNKNRPEFPKFFFSCFPLIILKFQQSNLVRNTNVNLAFKVEEERFLFSCFKNLSLCSNT